MSTTFMIRLIVMLLSIVSIKSIDHYFESALIPSKTMASKSSCGIQELTTCSVYALKQWDFNVTSVANNQIESLCERETDCEEFLCCAINMSANCLFSIVPFICTQEEVEFIVSTTKLFVKHFVCANLTTDCNYGSTGDHKQALNSTEKAIQSKPSIEINARPKFIERFSDDSLQPRVQKFAINLRINGSNGLLPSFAFICFILIVRIFY
jgi:hypothetical protein